MGPNPGDPGPFPGKKLNIKTTVLVSRHFSGYFEVHSTLYTHIIYAHAMYMIAL